MASSSCGISFSMESVIRGYHEYRSTWEAAYGELLSCQRETGNSYDSFAVGVMKNGSIVGHIPRKLSAVCAMFLQQGGSILCQVSGNRQYSRDLPQGGSVGDPLHPDLQWRRKRCY